MQFTVSFLRRRNPELNCALLLMKRILFVVQHRPDRNPSQRYRFEQYLDFLQANGIAYEFSYLLSEEDDQYFYRPGNYLRKFWILLKSIRRRWQDVRRARQFDAIFVQREAIMLGTAFFEKQFSKRSRLIYDFDDSIWLLNVSEGNRPLAWLKRPAKTAEIIQMADLVIAGNAYLAEYAQSYNPDTVIFPTTIDTQSYQRKAYPGKPADKVCIGWTGSSTTFSEFSSFEPMLKEIHDRYGDKVYVKVIGKADYPSDHIPVKAAAWSSETEVEELSEIDIGIMPLQDTPWSRGKCACKGLQYMALGIPAVMSAVGVNREIVESGKNGFLCESREEWIEKLSLLIESPELRERLGQAGKQTVTERFSVDRLKEAYLAHFLSVVDEDRKG
jgi:glycosyltransferase involved in cell wall biosynthesis